MTRLDAGKLKVRYMEAGIEEGPVTPRRYTLTHSDATGVLYLTIGKNYDLKQTSGLYTRFMRDEVLAEWLNDIGYSLNVYCHVRGGLVFGGSSMRESIFLMEMPLVIEALRYGDSRLYAAHPELDEARIVVHLQASGRDYKTLPIGSPSEYGLCGKE